MNQHIKLLIIRFSSLGDIAHCLTVVRAFKKKYPEGEVHWLTRSDFEEFLSIEQNINKVWPFKRTKGLCGIIKLALSLRKQNYSHIYDAHNNIRSHIVSWLICPISRSQLWPWAPWFIRRTKQRLKRILLFQFKLNLYPKPFPGMAFTYIEPLKKWGLKPKDILLNEKRKLALPAHKELPDKYICLGPSASTLLKRWPTENWSQLIHLFKEHKLVVLGGPEDDFCDQLCGESPHNTLNMAGQLSWLESAQVIYNSQLTISNDTGILHIADFFNHKAIVLIGPVPFGYPSQSQTQVLEKQMKCKPCSKHGKTRCTHPVYKKCLNDITPEFVYEQALKKLQV